MRYLLVMLLAATLLITACTKPVDNEEIEDSNEQASEEQVEENIDEEEPAEEELNDDNKKEEQPNKDQEHNNDANGDASNDKDNEKDNNHGNTQPKDNNQQNDKTDRDPNELLTEQEAIAKVKSYLQLQFEPDVHVVVDHEENGKYLVHVYEVIPGNGGVGHTSTRGWYYVDRKTGEIESMF